MIDLGCDGCAHKCASRFFILFLHVVVDSQKQYSFLHYITVGTETSNLRLFLLFSWYYLLRVLMGNAAITMRGDLCEDGCELTIANNWFTFGIILVPVLIGIWSVCYTFRNKQCQRRTDQNNECFPRCEGTVMNSTTAIEIYFPFIIPIILSQQVNIHRNVCLFTTSKTHTACAASVDIYGVPLVEINKSVNEVFSLFEERKLICYCDGSYSYYMQIGCAGFRASRWSVYRILPSSLLANPRHGSTDAEVLCCISCYSICIRKNITIH